MTVKTPHPPTPDAHVPPVHAHPGPYLPGMRLATGLLLAVGTALGATIAYIIVSFAGAVTVLNNIALQLLIVGLITIAWSLIVRHYLLNWLRRRTVAHREDPRTTPDAQHPGILAHRRPGATTLLLLTATTLVAWLVGQLVAMLAYAATGSNSYQLYTQVVDQPPVWQMTLLSVVMAPIAEECLMRGVVYPAARARLSVPWAVLISVAAFGVIHMNPVQLLGVIPMAVVAALAYEMTGHLAWPILVHALNNLLSVVVPVAFVNAIGAGGIILVIPVMIVGILTMMLLLTLTWRAHRRDRGAAESLSTTDGELIALPAPVTPVGGDSGDGGFD